jgi:hypothetical protein
MSNSFSKYMRILLTSKEESIIETLLNGCWSLKDETDEPLRMIGVRLFDTKTIQLKKEFLKREV